MNLERVHNVYFIGIGGIGMSNLARYFVMQNKQVAGYDKTPSTITRSLQNLGVSIVFNDDEALIPEAFLNADETLVVYTPAVPKTHLQLNYFLANGYEVLKRAAVLGVITQNTFCLAVAGTHGKTTTTAILGHLLKETNQSVTAFLGGISENYDTNFIMNGTDISVVEADEFDRSFLQLSPNVACVTSMDADHLDIYGNADAIQESFIDFTKKIKAEGKLFVRKGLPLSGLTYGIEEQADYDIQNLSIQNGSYHFDIKTPKEIISSVSFNKPGQHNLLNALVAFAMANETNASPKALAKALATFKGVKRRFSYHIQNEDLVYVDDYAHHPTEIEALHHAVREMYPEKHITIVFQPHLFSRTKDFVDDFALQLSKFDTVILVDIYPAREEPLSGVTSEWLLSKIQNEDKKLLSWPAVMDELKQTSQQVVLSVGAGDIGEQVEHIKKALQHEG